MADISEKPAVHAMGPEARQGLDAVTKFRQAKYNQNRANATAYSSRLTWLNGSQSIPPEERWQAIAVMAYHLARRRGFVGKPVKYWLAAEAKVDAELAIQRSTTINN
uniref:Uncharacterized protein n=1 Tax=Candidatus Kentrum sp. TUN TaxID=2126343 RepID=A0A450ZJZ7_9GAMM|nr:MAG: Protein of unknown function (DUF2934) [Candidatus Kentron sp. TUN]VFK53297.1 MAG: Protein of unknown function (DUF2934) [Candidatus Kentron sp. TUN]VFK54112.1 MAG: Protein of unknown function (DUF2934) [Candidatus Kentron sp. TUN]